MEPLAVGATGDLFGEKGRPHRSYGGWWRGQRVLPSVAFQIAEHLSPACGRVDAIS
jgi:hypothetical protein